MVRRTVISLPWEAVQAGRDLPADPVSLLKRALALHDGHYTDGTPEAEAWAGETRRYLGEACSDREWDPDRDRQGPIPDYEEPF